LSAHERQFMNLITNLLTLSAYVLTLSAHILTLSAMIALTVNTTTRHSGFQIKHLNTEKLSQIIMLRQRSIKTRQSQLNLIIILPPHKWPLNSELHINQTSLVSPSSLSPSIASQSHNITHYTLIQRSRYDLYIYFHRYLHGYDSSSEVFSSQSFSLAFSGMVSVLVSGRVNAVIC